MTTFTGMTVNLECENHKKNFERFCKTHDEPVCAACISSKHKTCVDTISLEAAAKNAKKSTALTNVEEIIDETTRNIEHWINDRTSMSKQLDEHEQEIKRSIHNARDAVNKRLDKLQEKLILELGGKYNDCQSKNGKILNFLKSMKGDMKKMKEETSHLKKMASDIQVFLATRNINQHVVNKTNEAQIAIKQAMNYTMELEMNSTVQCLIDNTNEFGMISVNETNTGLSLREAKVNQAQMHIPKIQTVTDVKLELKQRFKVKKQKIDMRITGCVILPNNNVLIAAHQGKAQIMEYNDKGEHVRDMPVSTNPFDLTLVDNDRVAVSYASINIEIINISNNIVEKKIKLGGNCYGISYQDGKLFIVVECRDIVVVDTTGRTLNTIMRDAGNLLYLTTTKDRIYYTDWYDYNIYCCSSTGEEIWVFNDDSVECPDGISVDNNQNLFVVGRDSNNLTIIQHDGKSFKRLLTKSDGLEYPVVVCYNKDKKHLFTANERNGSAGFYQVL